jgi:hypothetical protein
MARQFHQNSDNLDLIFAERCVTRVTICNCHGIYASEFCENSYAIAYIGGVLLEDWQSLGNILGKILMGREIFGHSLSVLERQLTAETLGVPSLVFFATLSPRASPGGIVTSGR